MVDHPHVPSKPFAFFVWIAATVLIGIVFLATWFPADSVEVERGEALWLVPAGIFALGAIVLAGTGGGLPLAGRWRLDPIDFVAMTIVVWMGIATLAVKGVGDFRAAINECWWWVAAVVFWITVRRCSVMVDFQNRGIALVIGLTVAQSALAAHQFLVSLPADRERFLADPDRYFGIAGVVAPEGSAERELFVARLFEGGPTGSFALANSLAGILVLGLVLAIGVFVHQRRKRHAGWLAIAIGLVGIVLWWTHSRSAMLATGVGIGWAVVVPWFAARLSKSRLVLLGCTTLGGALGAAFLLANNSALWSSFPRSLAFRFQYWKSTLAIAAQHPWVGIGPGNFQDAYPAYRLDEASEGIADPHNWFMETLAAGGWPAATMLIALLSLVAVRRGETRKWRFDSPFQSDEASAESRAVHRPLRWTVVTACLGGSVWAVQHWIASGAIPDPDGLFLGTIAGGLAGWWSWRLLRIPMGGRVATEVPSSDRPADFFGTSWVTGAVVGVLVHWMAAGGWTVPGNAIPWLLVSGMLVPRISGACFREGSASTGQRGPQIGGLNKSQWWGRRGQIGCASVLVSVTVVWYLTAHSKVSGARHWEFAAVEALERGQWGEATKGLAMAGQADPWDPRLPLREAEVWQWRLLRFGDSDSVRESWLAAIDKARQRNRRAARIEEAVGGQAMVVYQCNGNERDLRFAEEAYARAVERAPGEIRDVAQLTVLALARGDQEEAKALLSRLEFLSRAGEHTVRELTKVMVWAVEILGDQATRSGGVKRDVETEIKRLQGGG